jgi:hypothetical protein
MIQLDIVKREELEVLMMVERLPYTENVGQLIKDLNQATTKLEEMSRQQPQSVSGQKVADLMAVLTRLNTVLYPKLLEGKKLVPEEINVSIERALQATQLFQSTHPEATRAAQRNVDQAIASLTSSLTAELTRFDKNLKNLKKKFKVGHRVEKIDRIEKHQRES